MVFSVQFLILGYICLDLASIPFTAPPTVIPAFAAFGAERLVTEATVPERRASPSAGPYSTCLVLRPVTPTATPSRIPPVGAPLASGVVARASGRATDSCG